MNLSLKAFENIIVSAAASEPMIRSVRYLDEWKADTKKEDQYVVLLYDFVASEVSINKMGQTTMSYTLFLAAMDKCLNDRSNIGDVLSRTHTILSYLVISLRNNSSLKDIGVRFIDPNTVIQQASIKGDDWIKGCMAQIKFNLVPEISSCNLPSVPITVDSPSYEVDSPTSVLCAEVSSCPTIIQIQDDIDLLFTLTGGTSSSGQTTYVQNGVFTYTGGTPSLPTINVSGSTGGNYGDDAGTLAAYGIEGQLKASVVNSVTPALTVNSNGVGTGIYVSGFGAGTGVEIANTSGPALVANTSNNTATSTSNNSTAPTLEVTNDGTGPLAHYHNGGGLVLEISNNGSIDSEATINALILSGGTIYSAGTDLSLLLPAATYVQAGVNVYTGGTPSTPIVGVIGSPSFTAVTAGNFISGSTNLNSVFAPISVQNTFVQPGLNIATGGTPFLPVVRTLGTVTFTSATISTTLNLTNAGATTSGTIFTGDVTKATTFSSGLWLFDTGLCVIGRGVTFSAASNATRFISNILGEFSAGLNVTGNAEVSANMSAATYYSGNTLLTTSLTNLFNSTYAPISVQSTFVQNGTLTTTGGTPTRPTINVTLNPAFTTVSASTISATTLYEGTTALSSKYSPKDLTFTRNSATYILALADDNRVVDLSGATAQNCVVPRNAAVAFPIGSQIIVHQSGAGQVTFSADTGVTLRNYNSQTKLTGQYASASLIKKDTNEWILMGNTTT